MGACFGRCFNIKKSKSYRAQRTMYFRGGDNVEWIQAFSNFTVDGKIIHCDVCNTEDEYHFEILLQDIHKCQQSFLSAICQEQYCKVFNTVIPMLFDFLVDEFTVPPEESKSLRGISCLFALKKKQVSREVVLELTDDTWLRTHEDSKEISPKQQASSSAVVDVPLQPLDARSLLAARAVLQRNNSREKSIASSTPPSSLDLEWEHEGCLPIQPLHYTAGVIEEDGDESAVTNGQNGASAAGSTGWSRISTPDSLEWDPVEAPLATASERPNEELDAETEQLLSEIERLTSRALRETGDWSS